MGYVLARHLLGLLLRVMWRPRVSGLENIPASGPVILASNHLSFIDSVVIPIIVPRRVRFLAKAEYFEGTGLRGRAVALFFRAVDAVPVNRESQSNAMASLHLAMEVLRTGGVFGIYPEGTRSRDGRVYDGRAGVGWLALESGAPVVPVALVGTDRVQPIGARFPRPHRIEVRFGEPVDPARWSGTAGGRARRELTETVMERIGAMSPQVRAHCYNAPPAAA